MNIPSGLTPEQTRRFLQRQVFTGRYMILGTVILTVVNLICLLVNSDFYISYCVAIGYYATRMGKFADNGFLSVMGLNGSYTRMGLLLAFVILAELLALWVLAKQNIKWVKVAMGVLIVDTVALAVFSMIFFRDGILAVVWDLVIHLAVLWEMGKSVSAQKMLQDLPEPSADQSTGC